MFIGKQEIVKRFIKEYSEEIEKELHKYKQSKLFYISNVDHRKGIDVVINSTFEYYNYLMNHPDDMGESINFAIRHIAMLRHSITRMTINIYKSMRYILDMSEDKVADYFFRQRVEYIDKTLTRIRYIAENRPKYFKTHTTAKRRYVLRANLKKILDIYPMFMLKMDEYVEEGKITKEMRNNIFKIQDYYETLLHQRK